MTAPSQRESTTEIATLVRESYAKVDGYVAERIAHTALPENGGHVTSCGACTDAHCCTMLTTISVPETLTLVDALLALPTPTPGPTLTWKEIPRTENCAAHAVSGDYVIVCRPDEHVVHWRPKGRHVYLDTFKTIDDAKQAASTWDADGRQIAPSKPGTMTEYAAGFPRWWDLPTPPSTPGATPAVTRAAERAAWRDLLPALTRAARADCARGLTSRSRFLARVPCGLLDANRRCTVYASRPSACRLHTAVTPSRNCSPDAPEHADPSTVDAANPLPWSRNIGSHDFLEIEGALWQTHAQISHALEIPPETQGPLSYMVLYFLRVVVGDDAELNAALAGLPESPLHWMMAHVANLHAENRADAEADPRIADTHEKLYAIGRRVFGDSTKGTP